MIKRILNMRTQKRCFVNEYGPTLEKWETWYEAIKTKDIVKLFSDVCLFSRLWNTWSWSFRFFNLERNVQSRIFVNKWLASQLNTFQTAGASLIIPSTPRTVTSTTGACCGFHLFCYLFIKLLRVFASTELQNFVI